MLFDSFFEKLNGIRLHAFAASCLSTVLVQFATLLLPQLHCKVVFDLTVGGLWGVFVLFSIYRQYYIPALLYVTITLIVECGYCVLAFLFSYHLVNSGLDPRCLLCIDQQFAFCNDPCVPNRLLAALSVVLFIIFILVNGICVALIWRYARHLVSNSVKESFSSTNVSTNNIAAADDQSRRSTKSDVEEALLLTEAKQLSKDQ